MSGDESGASDESEVEVDEVWFGDEEEILENALGLTEGKKKGMTVAEHKQKRIVTLSRKKFTPNVHTIRHVEETIQEYASARNVTTWSGEDRHK
jgi:hypothetical protein